MLVFLFYLISSVRRNPERNFQSIEDKIYALYGISKDCNPKKGFFIPPCPQGYGIKQNCIKCIECSSQRPSLWGGLECYKYEERPNCAYICAPI